MKLIDQSSAWHKLWSVRLAILSACFGALELSLPLWDGAVPPSVFAGLSTISAMGAAVSRVIKQSNIEV